MVRRLPKVLRDNMLVDLCLIFEQKNTHMVLAALSIEAALARTTKA